MTVTRRSVAIGALFGTTALAAGGRALAAAAKGKPYAGTFGIDLAAMDRSVAPGDDFYRYVNGTWLKTHQIPSDMARFAEFGRLADVNAGRTRKILETAAKTPRSPEEKKIGDFYASLVDEAGREAAGAKPLRPDLDRIAAIASPAELARGIAMVTRQWLRPLPGGGAPLPPAPINTGVSVDIKNPTRYLPSMSQGGLGLPDRDYFFEPGFAKQREAYRAHLAAMFSLAGLSNPVGRATRTYALEERLAKAHWTRAEQRDPEKTYNLYRRGELAAKFPGLDWEAFLTEAGFGGAGEVLISQPPAIAAAAAAAREVPLEDWKDYLAYRAIRNFAPFGPKAFRDENFAFEDRTLAGTPEMPAVWKQAAEATDRALGQAVGKIYLKQYFPPAQKAKVQAMVGEIKAAMGRRLTALTWMSPGTKARALKKLAAVHVEVGAQEPPRDYSGLSVVRGDAYGNVLRAAAFEHARSLKRLGKPVDRSEWSMVAHTVNAQANPVLVKIMFPAGIMQGLFFQPDADPAVNYGAIGVVMGHELSHVFDDQGSKFDERGALNNWWTPEDYKRFSAATDALAAQYSTYEPLPGAHINGKLTNGENIADLAGLTLALDAYHASLGGKPAPVLGGLTGDQRFFMAFAQVYRTLQREDFLRRQLSTDPHSPGEWRAAEVRNMDRWYEVFGVKPGQKMYLPPEQRVRIW
jgi:putative endopeptidase